MADGRVDIAIRILPQQIPDGRAAGVFKRNLALGARGIKDKRKDCILTDVLGNILLGVIRPHLFLVDVFFKDVAEDIRINFVVGAQRAFVQMPLVLVKVVEDALEGLVGNGDVLAVALGLFEFMLIEQAAV